MEENQKVSKYLYVANSTAKAINGTIYNDLSDVKTIANGYRLFRIEICEEYESKIELKAAK